ncbi:hypothetical protein HNQ60_001913 [Povalibacter uvarum]|uniref:Uncharacterized protein n=1 Tax=Povalibacter uvarum TaxID=732238 RepID=A0A841HM45_9GAMM|nr:hypothetical protein [Povalibacter uvarum]MBB6093035.1 hypothetical protein [Povalibacter uvarum]
MKLRAIEWAMLAHCCASLLHFAHNGVFVDEYPNLPASITIPVIIWTWLGITAIGVVGYIVLRTGREIAGLGLIAAYAAFGFDGFAHYSLAAMAAHTVMMNVTIWSEAITAVVLLLVVGKRSLRVFHSPVVR